MLDFTGKWCSSCIILDKALASNVIPKYKNKVKFVKVDVDENDDLIKRYKILSIPTIIILKDYKEQWRKSSSISEEEVIKELNKAIKNT